MNLGKTLFYSYASIFSLLQQLLHLPFRIQMPLWQIRHLKMDWALWSVSWAAGCPVFPDQYTWTSSMCSWSAPFLWIWSHFLLFVFKQYCIILLQTLYFLHPWSLFVWVAYNSAVLCPACTWMLRVVIFVVSLKYFVGFSYNLLLHQ